MSILGSGTTLPKTDPGESDIYSHAHAVSVFPDSLNSLPSLQKLKHLRALDLEGCEDYKSHRPAHLCGLFALRYLSLRQTWINELPEEIGELSMYKHWI